MTLDAAAERYLDAVVARVEAALGDDLVGAYVVGSGALGDYLPGRSDLDVLVVCARALAREDAERLVAPLWHRDLPCPARGLEFVAYRADALREPGARVPFEVNLNTGSGMEDRVSHDPAEEPPHWFVLDVAIARATARPLVGPPPAEVIGPVERRHALAALDASLRWHGDEEPASANTVLNACRSWRYAVEDVWTSKPAAGEWALARLADGAVVRDALALRGGRGGELDGAAVAALLAEVRGAVRAAR